MAAGLVEEESRKVLRGSDRYMIVLRAVAEGSPGPRSTGGCAAGPIPRSDLTYLLDSLVRYGYLERLPDGSFTIPDPAVRYMASGGR